MISKITRTPKKLYPNSVLRSHKLQEERNQAVRIATGKDPDEHTIYNVLCPQIRSTWTKNEEARRRACGKRIAAITHNFSRPISNVLKFTEAHL